MASEDKRDKWLYFLWNLSEDKMSQLLVFYSWIWTKLFDSQELVGLFAKIFSDLLHQSCTLAITFTRYQLYVFRIDANPVHLLFHTLCMPLVRIIYSDLCKLINFFQVFSDHSRHLCPFGTYGTPCPLTVCFLS